MTSFENLAREELMILFKKRNLEGDANMSKQQLENIFAALTALKRSRPEKPTPRKPTLAPGPKACTSKKPILASAPKKHKFGDYEPKKIAGAFDANCI